MKLGLSALMQENRQEQAQGHQRYTEVLMRRIKSACAMQMCIAVPLKPLCSGGEVTLHAAVN